MENIITALEKFFYEVIGQLLPGAFLLVGLYFILPTEITSNYVPETDFGIWLFVAAAYCFGAAVSSIGSYFAIPLYLNIAKPIVRNLPGSRIEEILVSNQVMKDRHIKCEAFNIIRRHFEGVSSLDAIRNISMSSIDSAHRETTVRFMFLSLLSQGVATSVLILTIALSTSFFFNEQSLWPERIGMFVLVLIVGAIVALPFILREREFYERARRLPLDCYLAQLKPTENSSKGSVSSKKSVYLSGGHRSGWQDILINNIERFDFVNPSKNGLSDPKSYKSWDLYSVRNCEIIFAYFEATNPSGYGLALEVGYGAALGKHIIMVDEKSEKDRGLSNYLKIVREASDVVFDSLEDGVDYLKSLP